MKQVTFDIRRIESSPQEAILSEEEVSYEINELIDKQVNIFVYELTPKDIITIRDLEYEKDY